MRMPGNREAGIKAMHTALDAGLTYLSTGDFYDAGASELLVGCRTPEQVQNTVQALAITLTEDDLARIEDILTKEEARSDYMPAMNLAENGLFKW